MGREASVSTLSPFPFPLAIRSQSSESTQRTAVLKARRGAAHLGGLQGLLTQLKLLTAILLFIYLAFEDRNSRR